MGPYLEAHWSDVHISLLVAMQESLQPVLPKGLRVRAEERVISEVDQHGPLAQYPLLDRFLKIIDVNDGDRMVTAIDLLRPCNKAPGKLNAEYHRKLAEYAETGVNQVEIDLLRSPRDRLAVGTSALPSEKRMAYFIVVRRATDPEQWEVYPVALRAPIPWLGIPLRSDDTPAVLRLQPLIERVYSTGAYGDDIDYSKPPEPFLSPEDEAWADELLRKAGRR
jgi:hypothetical protein